MPRWQAASGVSKPAHTCPCTRPHAWFLLPGLLQAHVHNRGDRRGSEGQPHGPGHTWPTRSAAGAAVSHAQPNGQQARPAARAVCGTQVTPHSRLSGGVCGAGCSFAMRTACTPHAFLRMLLAGGCSRMTVSCCSKSSFAPAAGSQLQQPVDQQLPDPGSGDSAASRLPPAVAAPCVSAMLLLLLCWHGAAGCSRWCTRYRRCAGLGTS